jgi:hypothetical protein
VKRLEPHQKVFGIGLSKTGTSSLGQALNILGIKAIHYPCDENTYQELSTENYRLSVLKEHQGAVDISVAPFYRDFYAVYPYSKVILTLRDMESWLNSIEAHLKLLEAWRDTDPQLKKFSEFILPRVYGSLAFDERRFRYAYETHVRNVLQFFDGRPADLLVMDICAGDGWEKVCPFLGVPRPEVPFPRTNSFADLESWMLRRQAAVEDILNLIPPGETLALADQAQFGTLVAPGRRIIPFIERDGVYYGPPPDDAVAINELERARRSGCGYIAFG